MCGFFGHKSNFRIKYNEVQSCLDMITHRGPDSQRILIDDLNNIGLGFCRLSIIDLSDNAMQPMQNGQKTHTIVFNGEIVNYKELKSKFLHNIGHFQSNSDTEVLLNMYNKFGVGMLKYLRGMYSFAIWDSMKKTLFIARDPIGIKPLYYSNCNNEFYFASEAKALVKHCNIQVNLNTDSFDDYLTYGYIPFDKSIFENIHKLPAGHFLIYKDNSVTIEKYWDINFKPSLENEDELIYELDNLLKKSINLWTVSDTSLGVFLSSGIDSNTICGYLKEEGKSLNTFTIGFENDGSKEHLLARKSAEYFKSNHKETIVSDNNVIDLLNEIINYYDEPLNDSSIIPTYLVSKNARKNFKVALSGDGGDEIFAGYHRYTDFLNSATNYSRLGLNIGKRLYDNLFLIPGVSRLQKPSKFSSDDFVDKYSYYMTYFYENEKKLIYNNKGFRKEGKDSLWLFRKFYDKNLSSIKNMQIIDMKSYLVDDILTKVDRASMSASLEARPPLLDHEIVERIFNIEDEYLIKSNEKKYLLRRIADKRLSNEIVNRPKRGFGSPYRYWLKTNYNILIEKILMNGFAVKDGLLRKAGIKALVYSFTYNRWAKLWTLLIFELWYRRWIYNIKNPIRL